MTAIYTALKEMKNKKNSALFELNKKNSVILVILIMIIFVVLYLNEKDKSSFKEGTGTKLGQFAPDFETEYLDGSKFKFSEFSGKPVILNFWATWCVPCRTEMPLLQKVHNEGKIIVVGVNLQEDKKTVEKFVEELNITFPIVLDKDGSIEAIYNVLLKPTTYFIDENGVILDKKFGELSDKDLNERSKKLLK